MIIWAGRKKALDLFHLSQYETGMNLLCKSSKAAERAAVKRVSKVVRGEVSQLSKASCFQSDGSLDVIKGMDMKQVVDASMKKTPVFFSILKFALLSKPHATSSQPTLRGKSRKNAIPALGALLCMVAYFVNPRMCKVFQQCNSLQLWLAGCMREVSMNF